MTYAEAILYGAVQGITEYLPISSSAHLILLPKFLGESDPGLTFDVFLHLGTLLATLSYFWREWWNILKTFPRGIGKSPESGGQGSVHWIHIAVATVPALIAGAVLHSWVETIFRGNAVLMTTLVVGGVLLYGCDRAFPEYRSIGSVRVRDALWIGIAQCFALVPGISRSGSTMTGGRILGMDRASAARFSFLISGPITAAALAYELRNWQELAQDPGSYGPLFVACASSFVFGCLAIGGLLRLLRRFGYLSFAVYRVALAFTIWQVLGV